MLKALNIKFKIKNFRPERAEGLKSLYDLWASSYPPIAHNPLMRAEQAAMLAQLPDVRGKAALDLACGTGRYTHMLLERGAASVVALDFSMAMLTRTPIAQRARASMMQLPFATESFDLVVSGLAVGHADALAAWMREAARVLRHGGTLLYSDFHPFAAQAGWRRSFRAGDGRTYSVPHHTYTLADHQSAASDAGLCIEAFSEVRVGHELTEAFEGSAKFYRRWHGKPIVLVARLKH